MNKYSLGDRVVCLDADPPECGYIVQIHTLACVLPATPRSRYTVQLDGGPQVYVDELDLAPEEQMYGALAAFWRPR